jgi:Outer membrane lipoprotein-sorting protein
VRPALAIAFVFAVLTAVASSSEPTLPPGADPKAVAQELVQNLRSAMPEENTVLTGVLKIRDRDGATRPVPIECTVEAGKKSWRSVYQTFSNGVPERLAIVHWPNKPNDYFYARGTNELRPVPAAQANLPIGGSDFWLTDLGLDFLHWPQQRIIKTEMRKSRWCNVLESINPKPAPGGYGKVISWLDKETGGPLLAEAYDAGNKVLKNFELKSVKKGQLHEISIYNTQTKSTTRLEFDLKSKDDRKAQP